MLYTQLFRGPTSVASYPSFVFEELFKLQTTSAEPESTEITIPDPTRLGLPELDGVTSTTAININGEAVNFSSRRRHDSLWIGRARAVWNCLRRGA